MAVDGFVFDGSVDLLCELPGDFDCYPVFVCHRCVTVDTPMS